MAYPLRIWKHLTTTSLRKKTKQTPRFYCLVTAEHSAQHPAPGQTKGAALIKAAPEWFKFG